VPCYRLGHLLGACVDSILSQTYTNFEILVMDDHSPDDTERVARSIEDPRVRYIRNDVNLGHVGNFNKGIGLARGTYVWLISADDQLRTCSILNRYVALMDSYPSVGYVCCAGMELHDNREELARYSVVADRDTIFDSREFLLNTGMLESNTVICASAMARRACYLQHGTFPSDLPFGEDWYLWCLFALYYDVAYCAEPMVNYRRHALSLTSQLTRIDVRAMVDAEIAVVLRIKRRAEEMGLRAVAERCRHSIVDKYVRCAAPGGSKHYLRCTMSIAEADESISRLTLHHRETNWMRARMYARIGDGHFDRGEFAEAGSAYKRARLADPMMGSAWVKQILWHMGAAGTRIRYFRRRGGSLLGR
jgi:glycosyltransferase involved in cell wall biosynthesis